MAPPADSEPKSPLGGVDKVGLERDNFLLHNGTGYGLDNVTRPSTVGFLLSSSRLALIVYFLPGECQGFSAYGVHDYQPGSARNTWTRLKTIRPLT